jgi:hypothetical protein
MTLILAKVPRTASGLGAVDGSDRKQAGVVLGNDLTINTLTLKKDGVAQSNWPALSCGGANQAAVTKAGLVVSGSVGIGPGVPNRSLSITGEGGIGTYANDKNGNHEVLVGVDATAILSAMTASDLEIRTNNVTRMAVKANTGSIGIGLSNPDRNLTIGGPGASGVYANVKNGNHEILVGVDNTAIVSAMTASDLQIRTNNASRVTVKANTGDVGIGTDPGFKLDVSERMRVRQGPTPSAGIWFFQTTPNSDRGFVGMANDNVIGFWGNTGAQWGFQMNTTNGNVGIGVPPTGVKLFVPGIIQCAQVIGAKIAYVADRFINKSGDTLEQGDLVVISGDQASLYYGANSDIPIPEVDVSTTAYDTKVCGIVIEVHAETANNGDEPKPGSLAKAQSEGNRAGDAVKPELRMFAPEEKANMDVTKVERGQIGLMAILGAYASCKVDADIAPIKIGDLLTSSPTKGHTQKLTDSASVLSLKFDYKIGRLNQGFGRQFWSR